MPYLKDYWLTGSGRGTFEVIYPLYQTTAVQGTVTRREPVFSALSEAFIVGLL